MTAVSEERARSAEPIRVLANPEMYPAILELCPSTLKGKVLDVPSGHGAFAQQLLARGCDEIFCLDINETAFRLKDPTVKFIKHDVINALPFPDNFFDHVFSIEGIEHFENPWLFVRELCRVLKPGGRLYLTTPNTFSVDARLKYLVGGYYPRFRPLMQTPEHVMNQDVDDAHISPIYFWQLNYFLLTSGVKIEKLSSDRLFYKPQWIKRVFERFIARMIQNSVSKRKFPDPGITSEKILFGDCLILVARKEV
jgi:SAM-dependent methyltransferase